MPKDGLFRAILLVLVVSAMIGAAIMLAGEYYLQSQEAVRLGTGIAITCGALYFFFRLLGKREMRRRKNRDAAQEDGDPGEPMLRLGLGRSYRLTWVNETAFEHPIHLHGHGVHVIARNGTPLERPVIRDTVLIPPNESREVAFLADNPGDWMLHCHVPEHMSAGMMGYVTVG